MKPVIIIIILIPIIAIIPAVLIISSMQQQNLDGIDERQPDIIIWQKLQKTYLEKECTDKYIGQLDELEECFERVKEEQRLNPPTELEP